MGVSFLNGRKELLGGNLVSLLGSHGSVLGWLLLIHLSHVWLHHGLLHLRLHWSWLHVVVLSLSSLLHLSILVVLLGSWILSSELLLRLLGLHDLEKLLDDLGQVSLVVQHGERLSLGVLGGVVLPIFLVLDLFKLEVSVFLDLVVVDDELLSFKGLSLEGLLSLRASVRLLEANESEGVTLETVVELDVLNLSVVSEQSLEVVLLPFSGEVLDVKVASLLGVLVSDGFVELLLFSLLL